MDATTRGRRQPALLLSMVAKCMAIMGSMTLLLTKPAAAASAPDVFRCADASTGLVSYQQQTCQNQIITRFDDRDVRTDDQRQEADKIAKRVRELARSMAHDRRKHARHALAETGSARALTVIKKPQVEVAASSSSSVMPRKRDFRAAIPKEPKTKSTSATSAKPTQLAVQG